MTAYDWLLIFLGVGLVVMFTFERLVRALFALIIVWAATLAAAALYRQVAFRIQAATGPNPTLNRGLVFDALLAMIVVAGYVVIRLAFPVTKLPKIGILDHLMGLLLGAIVAILVVSLLVNSMGVMVMERWSTDAAAWQSLRLAYQGSGLRPFTSQVLAIYAWAFVPFFSGLPPVLLPQ
jgi:uncharacterized membrane protein required for colicin V production